MEQLTKTQLWSIASLLERQFEEAGYPDDMADYVLGQAGDSIVEIEDVGLYPITKMMDGKNVYFLQVHFMLYNPEQDNSFLDYRFKFNLTENDAKLLLIDDLSKCDEETVLDRRQDVIDDFRWMVEDEANIFWKEEGCDFAHEFDKEFWEAY